jgi:hypothetical protein
MGIQKPTRKLNLTLKWASQKLELKSPSRLFRSWWPRFKQYSLLEFMSQEPKLAAEWQAALDKPLLVVSHAPYKKYAKLIFDGRLWHRGPLQEPVCWIISSVTGKLLGKRDDISQLPVQNLGRNSHFSQTPLWQLLNLETPFPDPQTWQELNARTTDIAVSIFDVKSGKCIDQGTDFILETGTDQRYNIIYRDQPRPKDVPIRLELLEIEDDEDDKGTAEEDPCSTNRSTSASLHRSSLNLAYSLGLISSQEQATLSQQLGTTVASLVIHTDQENHLRHIFYRDVDSTFMQEVTCFDDGGRDSDYRKRAGESMLAFWRQVWTRKAELAT